MVESLIGFIDSVNINSIKGWCFFKDNPQKEVEIKLSINDKLVLIKRDVDRPNVNNLHSVNHDLKLGFNIFYNNILPDKIIINNHEIDLHYGMRLYNLQNHTFLNTPNFVIIGAQKSGTSSLHKHLSSHTDIFMSAPLKEPGFFINSQRIFTYHNSRNRAINNHYSLLKNNMLIGYNNEKYFGDSSTFYTDGNFNEKEDIPKNVYQNNPNTKIIYILRHPIERIISNYLHTRRFNYFQGEIDGFIKSDKVSISRSLYHKQISLFQKYFTKENILLLNYDKFIKHPQDVVSQVFKFLNLSNSNIDTKFIPQNVSTNRENFNENDLRFSKEVLIPLLPIFKKDLELLEKNFNFNIDNWDLEFSKWTKHD